MSQALPGFLITAPPSACVPAVLGALAVWIQNHLEYSLGVGLSVTIGGLGLQPTNIVREIVCTYWRVGHKLGRQRSGTVFWVLRD